MKKVVVYGRRNMEPLFVGTETECCGWIMSQASEHIKYKGHDGTDVMLVREIHDPDGIAYDVGRAVIYQIVEADGNETKSIYNN